MNIQLGFRYSLLEKEEKAWENDISTVYGIYSWEIEFFAI